MKRSVQHDPPAVQSLAAARLEQFGHITVLAGEAEFPRREKVIELLVPKLPLLDVPKGTDIDRLLQELMNLGKDAEL